VLRDDTVISARGRTKSMTKRILARSTKKPPKPVPMLIANAERMLTEAIGILHFYAREGLDLQRLVPPGAILRVETDLTEREIARARARTVKILEHAASQIEAGQTTLRKLWE
jgi:hypothetical protein